MPTIDPGFDGPISTAKVVTWEGGATGDTFTPYAVPDEYGIAGCVQVTGTFGGATVKLQVSNDNVTWFDMTDIQGNAISATAAGFFEFTTAGIYIRPAISGGTSDDLDVRVAFRGWRG